MNSREKVQHADFVAAKAGKRLPKGLVSAALWTALERRSGQLAAALDARDVQERARDDAAAVRNEARAGLTVAARRAKARLAALEADGMVDLPELESGRVAARLARARDLVSLAGRRRVRLDELEKAIAAVEAAERAYVEASTAVADAQESVDSADDAWRHAYRVLRTAVEAALTARGLAPGEVRRKLRAVFGRRKPSTPADPASPPPGAANPAV